MSDTTADPGLHQALGRLEGKVDMILAANAQAASRLDSHAKKIETLSSRVTAIETDKSTTGRWSHGLLAIAALGISLATFVKGMFH